MALRTKDRVRYVTVVLKISNNWPLVMCSAVETSMQLQMRSC